MKRWDPALSSLKKAVGVACPSVTTTGKTVAQLLSECPSITTDSNGNYADGNYFEIVSANYLGTTQAAQFQSGDQYGEEWHWQTKCTAVGECGLDSPSGDTKLAIMPRSLRYMNIYDLYYNHIAAVAESLSEEDYHISGKEASDSICPSGWRIPSGIQYKQTYLTTYGLAENAIDSVTFSRKKPLALLARGYSTGARGYPIALDAQVRLWTSTVQTVSGTALKTALSFHSRTTVEGGAIYAVTNAGDMTYGVGILCMLK